MKHTLHKGFTLIEVILVIALVGVLSMVMISIINPPQQFKKARDVERKSDLRQIQAALELYRSDNSAYPATLPNCDGALTGANGAEYLKTLPCDPKEISTKYLYTIVGNGYSLTACLENLKETLPTGTPCDTSHKVYTVTNP